MAMIVPYDVPHENPMVRESMGHTQTRMDASFQPFVVIVPHDSREVQPVTHGTRQRRP